MKYFQKASEQDRHHIGIYSAGMRFLPGRLSLFNGFLTIFVTDGPFANSSSIVGPYRSVRGAVRYLKALNISLDIDERR